MGENKIPFFLFKTLYQRDSIFAIYMQNFKLKNLIIQKKFIKVIRTKEMHLKLF